MKTILLLGSNLENPILQLETAISKIAELSSSYKLSSIYKTAAWGNTDQNDFYNQAMEIDTTLAPEDLLAKLIAIEIAMGRKRIHKWEPRIIDIDIIAMENTIVNTPDLQIPHPYMQDRMFVLVPFAELNKNWIHPVKKKSIEILIDECSDTGTVQKI